MPGRRLSNAPWWAKGAIFLSLIALTHWPITSIEGFVEMCLSGERISRDDLDPIGYGCETAGLLLHLAPNARDILLIFGGAALGAFLGAWGERLRRQGRLALHVAVPYWGRGAFLGALLGVLHWVSFSTWLFTGNCQSLSPRCGLLQFLFWHGFLLFSGFYLDIALLAAIGGLYGYAYGKWRSRAPVALRSRK